MEAKLLCRMEPLQVRHMARELITNFGEQAPNIARSQAERCIAANALIEAQNWLEVADAIVSILPGPLTKTNRSG
jgi:hypothetical protein